MGKEKFQQGETHRKSDTCKNFTTNQMEPQGGPHRMGKEKFQQGGPHRKSDTCKNFTTNQIATKGGTQSNGQGEKWGITLITGNAEITAEVRH